MALCRLMAQRCSVLLRPMAALIVPDTEGGWRRVSCYRADGPQPVVPGAVPHPVGETAAANRRPQRYKICFVADASAEYD